MNKTYELSTKIRSRGGVGQNTMWEWTLLRSDQALPLKKGVVNGTLKRAEMEADAALRKYQAAESGK